LPDDVLDRLWDRCCAEWAQAGIPQQVEDLDVLGRIATIVVNNRRKNGKTTEGRP
jgi:hypothetical protein